MSYFTKLLRLWQQAVILTPILQTEKLRLREGKSLHTTDKLFKSRPV